MGCDISKVMKKDGSGLAYTEQVEKRILLLGLDNAGKTSILLQFKEKMFMENSVPTIGLNIEQVSFRDFSLTFWDVGGQATKLWKHYFDSVDAVMFVVDVADREKLAKARSELAKVGRDKALENIPCILMLNKVDLEDKRIPSEELLEKLNVATLKTGRTVLIQECSAMQGVGIWEGLSSLIDHFETIDQ